MATAATNAHAYDALHVPSLDFRTMAFDASLVRSLQTYGIVTIKNVPDYAAQRSAYLRAAAECVWQRRAPGEHSGILHQTLADGTQRLTISSIDGVDGLAPGDCVEYQLRKQQFSDVVTQAIDALGAAFDATLARTAAAVATIQPEQSLHALVTQADVIDHFHTYIPVAATNSSSAVSNATSADRDASFALHMHSDSGVFIAMSAPAFYRVALSSSPSLSSLSTSLLQEIANPDPAAGLFIKLRDSNTVVRPVQPPDELTIMIGDGFAAWTQLRVAIPAVVHAMRMPQTSSSVDAPLLRAWFGKMVLLPAAAPMQSTGTTYAAYSRALSALAQQSSTLFPADVAAAACPTLGRRQLAVGACAYRRCHPFATTVKPEKCAYWCNAHTMDAAFDFAALCAANCLCAHHAVADGTYQCWMSCFEVDESCSKHQSCKDLVLDDGVRIPQRTCSDVPPPLGYTSAALRMRVKVEIEASEVDLGSDSGSDLV